MFFINIVIREKNSVQDSESLKDCKNGNGQFPKTNNFKQTIKCWPCGKGHSHRFMNC